MSAEDIAICSICQMTFGSHEEVLVHTCVQIKEEQIEAEEMNPDEENNKVECDIFGNIKRSKKNNGVKIKVKTNEYQDEEQNNDNKNKIVKKKEILQIENSEDFTGEAKNKRERPKSPASDMIDVETIEYQDEQQVSDNSTFEQFIANTIQQVDELCESIRTGDPHTKRSEEVNLKLKSAVNCYRSKFNSDKEIFAEIENVENHKIRRPWTDDEFSSKDSLHDSKGKVENCPLLNFVPPGQP
jgi:hypothetical protein